MNQMSSVPSDLLRAPPGGAPGGPPPHDLKPIPLDDTPEFLAYWRAVMQRKWAILTFTLLVGTIAGFIVAQERPVYRATATVLIETFRPRIMPTQEVYQGVFDYPGQTQTQAGVIKSRPVAERVVDRLRLAEHPDFDPRQAKPSKFEQWLTDNAPTLAALLVTKPKHASWDDAAARELVISAFGGGLSVEPIRQSQLVKVSYEAHDRALAASIANAVSEVYIELEIETRASVTKDAGQAINQRLGELKAKLDASEKSLQSYREREGLIDSKSLVAGGGVRQVDELTNKLVDARVKRSEAEEVYNQIKGAGTSNYGSVPVVMRSPGVMRARELETEADKKLAEMAQRYGPKHPKYVAAESDLNVARENARRQVLTVVESVAKEYTAARATEKTIEDELGRAKGAIQTVNRKEIQLGLLERDAATNRQIYEAFLARYKETSAARDFREASARLVDAAVAGGGAVRPNKLRTVSIAGGIALILGVIGALLLNRLDNTVKTRDDVERKLGQPFLAALPVLHRRDKVDAARTVLDKPRNVYAEGIRTASTGVLLSALDTPRKIVTVTSSVPGEGKSTFSINLGLSQAKTQRVLVIEADMRRPCFAKALGFDPAQTGLSELVSGQAEPDQCIAKFAGSELSIMVAGHIPPNPLELLVSHRFRDALATLYQSFDLIIIDTPPVQLVSDALVVGSMSTGLIYIVMADDTPAPLAHTGLKRIVAAGIPVFGVVLNQQDFKKAERYYGEYSGYGKYGYGKPYGGADAKRT